MPWADIIMYYFNMIMIEIVVPYSWKSLFKRGNSLIWSASVTNERNRKGKQRIVQTKIALLHWLFVAWLFAKSLFF